VFTDVSRADVLFHLACTRLKRGSVANAAALLTVALDLADRSGEPCDRLRAYVLERRARCYQRQRDWEAARCDIERALELAERLGEPRTLAHVYFQASIVAEREQQWLIARFYAEQAHGLYEQLGDVAAAAKTLNNLGGLAFLLGEPEAAQSFLSDAFRISIASGDEANAGYALSSLAQVHLRVGEPELAEQRARRALQLLATRGDHQAELGSAQLVLGRALMELGRLEESGSAFLQAEVSLTSVSASHRASAWMALGELESRRGAHEVATSFYRRAAEALQDIHF
jgi:tetratricopeptide (TPR) repeat protein